MRVLLSVSTAFLALAIATPALAQNIKPSMMPKGSIYNPYGSGPASTPQASGPGLGETAANIGANLGGGAAALAHPTNAFTPGDSPWADTAGVPKFDPRGATSAGTSLVVGTLANAALNPDNSAVGSAFINGVSTAYGTFAGSAWAATKDSLQSGDFIKNFNWQSMGWGVGGAVVSGLVVSAVQNQMAGQPSITKAIASGVTASLVTAATTFLAGASITAAGPAIMIGGLCTAATCVAGDIISGNWKPLNIDPSGVPGNNSSNSNQNFGGQPPENNTGANTNTNGATRNGFQLQSESRPAAACNERHECEWQRCDWPAGE